MELRYFDLSPPLSGRAGSYRPHAASSGSRRGRTEEPDNALKPPILRQLTDVDPLHPRRAVRCHHFPGEPQAAVVFIDPAGGKYARSRHLLVELRDQRSQSFPSCGIRHRVRVPAVIRPGLLEQLSPLAFVLLIPRRHVRVDDFVRVYHGFSFRLCGGDMIAPIRILRAPCQRTRACSLCPARLPSSRAPDAIAASAATSPWRLPGKARTSSSQARDARRSPSRRTSVRWAGAT